jgi:hypothetical protein
MRKLNKIMVYAATSHNRSVYAAPPVGGLASIRLGQSLRSFPRLIPAHSAGPGLCFAKPLSGPAKRRKQPERYAKCRQNILKKWLTKVKKWNKIKNKEFIMDKPSEQELDKYEVIYEDDTKFTAYARLLQSKWREKRGYPMGKSAHFDKFGKFIKYGKSYGNYIDYEFARKNGSNFLTQKIWSIAKNEMEKADIENKKVRNSGGKYDKYRFICNLLTSQALCFNLFAEFLDRKDILLKIFNEIKPDLIDKIVDIKFEYSPGRGEKEYLGDHTAFDVFIEYEKDGEKSFLGIEAKYVETLQEEKPEIAENNYNRHPQYKEITENCGLFKPNVINKIKKPPYSQIWRDHLLSISLKYGKGKIYDNGYFVYLYPFNNSECRSGIKGYMNFLEKPETNIFELYVEDFIKIIEKNINEEWTKELFDRYINGI